MIMDESDYWSGLQGAIEDLHSYVSNLDIMDELYVERLGKLRSIATRQSDDELEPWLGPEISDFLGLNRPPKVTSDEPVIAVLQQLPKLLVFLPIVWTWFCLSQASSAFSRLIAVSPSSSRMPFLTLWHENFRGELGPLFSFHSFAIGTVLTVLLIVISLIGAQVYEDHVTSRHEMRLDMQLLRMHQKGSELERQMSRHRQESPKRFVVELTSAARTIRVLHTNAAGVLANLDVVSATAVASAQAITTSSVNVGTQLASLTAKFAELSTLLVAVQAAEQSLSQVLQKLPDVLELAVGNTRGIIADEIKKPLNDLVRSLEGLEDHERLATRSIEQIGHFLGQAFSDNSAVISTLHNTLSALDARQSTLDTSRTEITVALDQIRSQLATVQSSLDTQASPANG